MRLLLIAMIAMIALLAMPADACPRGETCVAATTRAGAAETPAARTASPAISARSMLEVATAPESSVDRLTTSLATYVVPRRPSFEMPWIWVQLRDTVYSQLPRWDGGVARRPENRFSLVLSPVVITNPQDTVPGVGVQGGF